MKYYEFCFHVSSQTEEACDPDVANDILCALLAEIGFESFDDAEDGLKAYIQTQNNDEEALQQLLADFPLPDMQITYQRQDAEYANWNEQWEKEGFKPIVIEDRLCVHDELHDTDPATGAPLPRTQYELIVTPRLAFGSGTHPTTRQLLKVLLDADVSGKHVIDAGCGTGILGMLCALKGARNVSAYDIDEWSTTNSLDNAQLNHIKLNVYLGDSGILPKLTDEQGKADLLIANINRNILLHDMPAFKEALAGAESKLLLSGFYEEDIPYLVGKAEELGMREVMRLNEEGWCVLLFAYR